MAKIKLSKIEMMRVDDHSVLRNKWHKSTDKNITRWSIVEKGTLKSAVIQMYKLTDEQRELFPKLPPWIIEWVGADTSGFDSVMVSTKEKALSKVAKIKKHLEKDF